MAGICDERLVTGQSLSLHNSPSTKWEYYFLIKSRAESRRFAPMRRISSGTRRVLDLLPDRRRPWHLFTLCSPVLSVALDELNDRAWTFDTVIREAGHWPFRRIVADAFSLRRRFSSLSSLVVGVLRWSFDAYPGGKGGVGFDCRPDRPTDRSILRVGDGEKKVHEIPAPGTRTPSESRYAIKKLDSSPLGCATTPFKRVWLFPRSDNRDNDVLFVPSRHRFPVAKTRASCTFFVRVTTAPRTSTTFRSTSAIFSQF